MNLRCFVKKGVVGLVAMTLFLFPVSTLAEASESPAAETNTTPETSQSSAPSSSQGPTSPPGPERKSYTYNANTGLYESDHYTWNPATGETQAKDSSAPTYNAETNTWDTTKWQYDAAAGKYVPRVTQTPGPAPGAKTAAPKASVGSAAAASAPKATASAVAGRNATAVAQAGNNVSAIARSGNTAVSHNTTAGSATSGNAQSMVNVLNLLQSSWGAPGDEDITTFTADINGSVVGDLLIDPSSFDGDVLPATGQIQGDLDVNVANSGSLDNTVVAGAISGNGSVDHNTSAGNAATGTATALVNVVNLINTTIGAGKSFVGTININGDFEGDILLPEEMRSLLGGNSSTNPGGGDFNGTFNDTQTITNNVSLAAQSGAASVAGNTSAGSALSGKADTNLTIYNLTGRQIIGSNALLVFVNVLGQWVGMIVDAPAGATAAMLGSATTNSGALSRAGDTDVSFANSNSITNNITAYAASGDATITHNTKAGNAASGDAKVGVNVANFSGNQLSLADWFGILFINVLGSWHGSFGVDTAMGDVPAVSEQPAAPNDEPEITDVKVFQLVSDGGTKKAKPASLNSSFKAVLASSHVNSGSPNTPAQVLTAAALPEKADTSSKVASKGSFSLWVIAVTLFISGVLLSVERLLGRRQQTTQQ